MVMVVRLFSSSKASTRWSRYRGARGRRHEGYGVRPAHYDTVGAALFKTLEQALSEDFTPQVRAAWAHLRDTIAHR